MLVNGSGAFLPFSIVNGVETFDDRHFTSAMSGEFLSPADAPLECVIAAE